VDTPTRSRSFGEGEEKGEITPPPLSSLCLTPPLLSDIVSWQVGTTVNECWLERIQRGIRSSTDSLRQLHLTLVTYGNKEGDEHSACINGTNPPFWDFAGPGNFGNCHGR
jgi:hypothetical protein